MDVNDPPASPTLDPRASPRRPAWPHVLLSLLMAAVLLPGLGWRHLWNDEADTAERARAVLHTGVPTVFDPEGRLSTNMAGLELEDGDLHRFTPWAQFYLAAAGLLGGRVAGASEDAAVRFPFVLLHGACSGLASWGLVHVAAVPLGPAVVVGAALGLQSVRMVYNRQARYPALTDLLVIFGMVGIGRFAARRRGAGWVAVACAALPQTHPLSGLVFSWFLAGLAVIAWVPAWRTEARAVVRAWIPTAAATLLSTGALLLLTRPWRQTAWGAPGLNDFRGFDHSSLYWALAFALGSVVLGVSARARGMALPLVALVALQVAGVRVADLHPASGPRYYMSAVLPLMLWPLALGFADLPAGMRRAWPWLCVALLAAPDIHKAWQGAGHLGLRLVLDDAAYARAGVRQPLHVMVDHIRKHGTPGEAVLFDVVPQHVNWYLRDRAVALLPDLTARSPLNEQHRAWAALPPMPRWHARFPTSPDGAWSCAGACDYRTELLDAANPEGPYRLRSGRLGTEVLMCPVLGFDTSRLINAPYEYLTTGITAPAGLPSDKLVLAQPCAVR